MQRRLQRGDLRCSHCGTKSPQPGLVPGEFEPVEESICRPESAREGCPFRVIAERGSRILQRFCQICRTLGYFICTANQQLGNTAQWEGVYLPYLCPIIAAIPFVFMYFSSGLTVCQQRDKSRRRRKISLVLEFLEWFPCVHLNGNSVMCEDVRSHFAENVIGRKETEQPCYNISSEKAHF